MSSLSTSNNSSSSVTTRKKMPKATDAGQNPFIKALITGPAVLAEMLTGGLFMENVKIEKQRTSHNYFIIMRRVGRQGLVDGFWSGFLPWGFSLGMAKGLVLGGARSFFLNLFDDLGMESGTADVCSGFAAGGVQGIFMSPILLARTRVLQDLETRSTSGKRLSVGQAIKESVYILNRGVRDEGVMMLFTGMPQFIFKRMMDWGSRFVIMKYFREYFYSLHIGEDNPKLTNFEKFASSFLGGALSVGITMPIDRMMPIIQASRATKKPIFTVMKELYAKEGLSTLQRGFVMRVIHCGWHTTWAIFIANQITDKIMGKRNGGGGH